MHTDSKHRWMSNLKKKKTPSVTRAASVLLGGESTNSVFPRKEVVPNIFSEMKDESQRKMG